MQITEQAAIVLANHQKKIDDLKKNIKTGDWQKVAEKLSLKKHTAYTAFYRIGSRHHNQVVATMKQVIAERLETLNSL